MDKHRKMAEELHLEYLKDCSGFVDIVSNALRTTASKSEKDGYERGRKDSRLLLEKIGKPLREFKANTIADYEKTYGCDPLEWGICDGEKAIDEALAIIKKEKGNV